MPCATFCVLLFYAAGLSLVPSLVFASTKDFIAGSSDWDDVTSAGLQLQHTELWQNLRFHSFLDFLFPEIIANYSTPSSDEKNVTFPSGQWMHMKLLASNDAQEYIKFEVTNMSPEAIVAGFVPTSLVFFVQVQPWIEKNNKTSVLRTGYRMRGSESDPNLVLHARNTLAALIRSIHDTARSKVGAYPCSSEFRTFGGTCNNPKHPDWGSSQKALKRMDEGELDPSFIQGTNNFPVGDMPNPRTISRTLFQQNSSNPSRRRLTMLAVFWGQFIDHDIGLTPQFGDTVFEERMDIELKDIEDPLHERHGGKLDFTRSRGVIDGRPCCGRGIAERFPRDPINSQSSFIDASHVYGCQRDRVSSLRSWEQGKLRTGQQSGGGEHFLPRNRIAEIGMKLENAGSSSEDLFVAGDVRANEQPVLTSLHTIFMREHNRLAAFLKERFPCWKEEKVFQHGRKIVAAQIQHLTYKFFVPAILGTTHGLKPYQRYSEDVDPSIANFFSTCAFRFGHSMVSDTLTILETGHKIHPKNGISLRNVFFSPSFVSEVGIEPLLLGASHQIAEEVDTQVVGSLQSEMFKELTGGIDLVALNIQRGRDHGIPKYNDARELYGLGRKTSFAQVTSNSAVQQILTRLYSSVDEMDSFVGGLAEDHLSDSELGELFHTAVRDQFTRLRDGDRFFYKTLEWSQELAGTDPVQELSDGTLTLQDIIVRNSGSTLSKEDFGRNMFMMT